MIEGLSMNVVQSPPKKPPSARGLKQSILFIHATSVHQGGGQTLLDAFLRSLPDSSVDIALLDSWMAMPEGMLEGVQIIQVTPSVVARLKAERWLADNVRPCDIVLCFGNLPPMFKLRGRAG